MSHTKHKSAFGLATLELVLTLPLLMFLMALLINAGTSAAWRLRAQGVARHAVWRDLWPRGAAKPDPAGWPEADASFGVSTTADEVQFDLDELQLPVVRGPLRNITVDDELLDPSNHGRVGQATIRRERPILPRIGAMQHAVRHRLFDLAWTYPQTGVPSNNYRRIKALYDMHENELGQYGDFMRAVSGVWTALRTSNLLPLGHPHLNLVDPDFPYYGRMIAPYGNPPQQGDYHPRLQGFATLDADWVRANRLQNDGGLIDSIEVNPEDNNDRNVPTTVARAYLNLYQRAIQAVQSEITLEQDAPRPNQQRIAALEAELAALQAKVNELNEFISQL